MGTSFEELYSEYTNASLPIFTGDEYYGDMLEAMDSGKHEISLFNRFFEKKIDLKWVEAIEACTVALDTIVRNPRKFIVQEEEIVPIEMDLDVDEVKVIDEIPEVRDDNSFLKVTEKIKEQTETYLTYRVYIFKQDDTIEKVLEKYDITLEQLSDYNNLDEISEGVKLVIPSFNDQL